jgi:hypothetical protein
MCGTAAHVFDGPDIYKTHMNATWPQVEGAPSMLRLTRKTAVLAKVLPTLRRELRAAEVEESTVMLRKLNS